jgi:hypothetical protein
MTMAPDRSFKFRLKASLASFVVATSLIASPFVALSDEPAPAGKVPVPSPGDVSLKKEEPKMAVPASENAGSAGAGSPTASTSPPSDAGNSVPTAPPRPNGAGKDQTATTPAGSQTKDGFENYPTVGRMEVITFGNGRPEQRIDQRLNALEDAVFKKTFSEQTLFDRTQRLKAMILGNIDEPAAGLDFNDMGAFTGMPSMPLGQPPPSENNYLDEVAQNPENQKESSIKELEVYGQELVNLARGQQGLSALVTDEQAQHMASEHVADLCSRCLLSHISGKGANPDLRYTAAGGSDAVTESLVSLKPSDFKEPVLSKAAVALLLKSMFAKQDDRDAILSAEATGMGFSLDWVTGKTKVLACLETSTKHGIMDSVPTAISVGDKIEIKGLVQQPYKFDRISLAWEGAVTDLPSAADEGEEALPYFPPLDYTAYASKAEHDYEKTLATLRTVGIIAAIAGGVFMPPVAFAAPLIAASGGMSEPKPLSDIPVHGGVKTEGMTFNGKIPFSNSGKEGIYYVTVWAFNGRTGKSIPISRRAFQVGTSSVPDADGLPHKKKEKHHKKKGDKGAEITP